MPDRKTRLPEIPPITDFESYQRARPLIFQKFATLLGVWQVCADRKCARARRCRGDGARCLAAFMQAIPDAERREMRYTLQNSAAGLAPAEAFARAQARVAREVAQEIAPAGENARHEG